MTDKLPPGRVRLGIPGALTAARQSCQPGCFGYHATWQLFRRTGLKANPTWHIGFYRDALAHHPLPEGRLRVLICAASDETLLATMARLLGRRRIEVHLVDACATPLALAAAYARRHGIALSTQQAHAPELPDLPGAFDLAVTDGLLSLLDTPADRDALLARLAGVLSSTGLLLYTTRIAGPAGVLEYDRVGRTVQATAARLAWPGHPQQRRELAARIHTRPSRSSPFTTPNQLCSAFARHFTHVALYTRTDPPSLALRLHPAAWTGRASHNLGVTAHTPKPA